MDNVNIRFALADANDHSTRLFQARCLLFDSFRLALPIFP